MVKNRLVMTGLVGSVIAALCCFTPILVVLFGLIGLGALVGYLDYVLFPALAVFLGLTIYGLARQRQAGAHLCCEKQTGSGEQR